MTRQTKNIRFAFTNARSGSVDFSRPLAVISERCQNLRYLDLTFATDTLLQTKPGVDLDSFNGVFLRDCLAIVKELSTYNNIQTLKLLMCNKAVLQEISKLSKLTVLEIMEASVSIHEIFRKVYFYRLIIFSCYETRIWPTFPKVP